jgi:hypothetical protein
LFCFFSLQQTDGGGGDILDIADTNQMSTDYMLQLLSDANNNDDDNNLATADGTEEHQMELVGGGLLSLKNSQGSMDETLSSWEMQLPKLLVPTVHSPSPQQKYYRRKVF